MKSNHKALQDEAVLQLLCWSHTWPKGKKFYVILLPILRTNLRRAWSYNISEAFKFMLELARLSLDIYNFIYLKIVYNLPKDTHALMNSNSLKILITCIFVCICACEFRCLRRPEVLDTLELELQVVLSILHGCWKPIWLL